ncbi:MAG: hypothetical protein Q7S48_03305 [bacterium]|nr:hypothetical protein [bacterium]
MGREGGPSAKDMGLTEKDTKVGEFDPKNYKSYADLPEDQKPNFVELDGGAFVRVDDKMQRELFEDRAKRVSEKFNKKLEKDRSLWDKITAKEPEGKVSTMDVLQATAEDRNKHRFEDTFREDFTRPSADKWTMLQTAEEKFNGMTKEKLDARMEEVYQEMYRNDPSVDRDKLFRELRKAVLREANNWLEELTNPFYVGAEEEIKKIGNTMRLAVGESEV